ncbi:MAG: low molecular weight protein-tyrosine-phosphatase [Kiritimatiellia bacterium]
MRILFLCHGNICRSPMAEFVMKHLLRNARRSDIIVESAALHTDEIGSDIHYGTRQVLDRRGIEHTPRRAWLLTADKAREYDYLIGMDSYNIADLRRLVHPEDFAKIHKLPEFAGKKSDIADPWYTGNFERTYSDVLEGCLGLMDFLG